MSSSSLTGTPVLIVEDDEPTAQLERRALHRSGRTSHSVGGIQEALQALKENRYLAVLLDYRLPDGEPWAVLEAAQRSVPRIPVILVTAMGDERIAAQVLHRGGADYVIKTPGFWDQLPGVLDRVLRLSAAEQANARLAAIVESSDDAILSKDCDGVISSWNPGAESLFGYSAQEAIGRSAEMLVPADRLREHDAVREHAPGDSMTRQVETIRVRKDGSRVYVSATEFPIFDMAGRAIGSGTVSRDITERKRAEQALRGSEARHRALFDQSPLAMWLFERETLSILAVNDAAVRLYGYSRAELLSMTLPDFLPAEDIPRLVTEQSLDSSNHRHPGISRHLHKDRSEIRVDVHIRDVQIGLRPLRLVVLHDVTEQWRLEEQLRQAQKLEAIGQLTGGIAHDFNNLVTVINGYSGMLLDSYSPNQPGYEELSEIHIAGERAADLTRQLLAFSRKQKSVPKALDLNGVVANLDRMLRRLIGEHITLRANLARHLDRVRADPGQIEQVIVNLVVNARDAMSEGGTVTIDTENVALSERLANPELGVEPGLYVLLSVTDTGTGMDKETLSHVFEPFFTTKEPGRGTGLGLATVFGIVKQSGGHIRAESEPGRGCVFKIYFPRIDEEAVPGTEKELAPASAGAGQVVLVVEDDDSVRKLTRRILERNGYVVLEAAGPLAGLAVIRAHGGTIDLLLSDVVMPQMSGPDFAKQVVALRRGIKVLFVSGYAGRAVTEQGGLDPNAPFLPKPFSSSDLLEKIRQVLGSPAP